MSSNVLRAGGVTAATSAANVLFGIGTGVLVARLLGPEGRGIVGAITFWPQIVAGVGLLSLPAALTYHSARADDEAPVNGAALVLVATTSIVTVGCALLVRPLFATVVSEDLLPLLVLFVCLFVPTNHLSLTLGAADQGQKRFWLFNVFRVLPQAVYLTLLLVLYAFDVVTIRWVSLASIAGTVLLAAVRLAMLVVEGRVARPGLLQVRSILSSAVELHGAQVASILGRQLDRAFVLVVFSAEEIGLYFAAVMVATAPMNVINMALNVVAFPHLAAADQGQRQRAMTRLVQIAMVMATLIGTVIALLASTVVPLLLGDAYRPAVPVVIAQAVALLPVTLHVVLLGAMRGIEMWRARTAVETTLVVIFLAIAPLLGWKLGIVGLPIAQLIANAITTVIAIRLLLEAGYLSGYSWWGLSPKGVREVLRLLRKGSVA